MIKLPDDDDVEEEGLIKANGEINWDCPCLQGMAYGPCGGQFRAAFSCFHYSEAEVKGSDCIDQFRDMQQCFVKYPEIYGKDDEEDESTIEQEIADNKSEKVLEKLSEDSLQESVSSDQASPSPSRAVIAAQVNDFNLQKSDEQDKKTSQNDTKNN
mgnify:CR=1 FL=1